jgi:hypothetical protein
MAAPTREVRNVDQRLAILLCRHDGALVQQILAAFIRRAVDLKLLRRMYPSPLAPG